MMMFVYSS